MKRRINQGVNLIAHPVVAFSANFWKGSRYVPTEIPQEDLLLWQRSIEKEYNFEICSEYLLFYRLHSNQITANSK